MEDREGNNKEYKEGKNLQAGYLRWVDSYDSNQRAKRDVNMESIKGVVGKEFILKYALPYQLLVITFLIGFYFIIIAGMETPIFLNIVFLGAMCILVFTLISLLVDVFTYSNEESQSDNALQIRKQIMLMVLPIGLILNNKTINKHKKEVEKKYPYLDEDSVEDKLIRTFNNVDNKIKTNGLTSVQRVITFLNTPIELETGYITYLSNILNVSGKHVKANVGFIKLEDMEYEDMKNKELLLEGDIITLENVETYINQLIEEYKLDTQYQNYLHQQKVLLKKEKDRVSQLKYKEENKERINELRDKSKEYLTKNKRVEKAEDMRKESLSSLRHLKQEVEDIRLESLKIMNQNTNKQ